MPWWNTCGNDSWICECCAQCTLHTECICMCIWGTINENVRQIWPWHSPCGSFFFSNKKLFWNFVSCPASPVRCILTNECQLTFCLTAFYATNGLTFIVNLSMAHADSVSLHFISFCWSDYPFCCHSMCFICAMMTIEQQQFPGLMKRGYIFKSQMDIFWTKIAKIKLLSETILQCIQSDPAHQMPGWIYVWVGFGYAKYSTILFSLINQIYYGNLVTQWNGFIRYFVVFIFAHPTNMLHLMIIHFISLNLIKLFFVLWLSSNNDI